MILPCFTGDPDPTLGRFCDSAPEWDLGLWFLLHPDLKRTDRVLAFRDHMVGAIQGRRRSTCLKAEQCVEFPGNRGRAKFVDASESPVLPSAVLFRSCSLGFQLLIQQPPHVAVGRWQDASFRWVAALAQIHPHLAIRPFADNVGRPRSWPSVLPIASPRTAARGAGRATRASRE